jgi:uncharacterized protein YkvS
MNYTNKALQILRIVKNKDKKNLGKVVEFSEGLAGTRISMSV